ncbi:hypothetical protein JTE90_024326 [Oedothorax gibbosus]|uniref:Kielin/chordin-like protein n=1 Tax=Oedothorax gibbosus TaxID=931172 RepID=A0AAV6VZC2_9ARAC|nr:hypothetical protein JTE90_024326 [Oedothorax gibbosus]
MYYLGIFVTIQCFLFSSCIPEIRWTDGGQDFCIVEGKPYRNGDRIPRDNPCHVCMCHLGRATCYWMKCPPAPEGCIEYANEKYCNPALYVCDIPEHLVGYRHQSSADSFGSGSGSLQNSEDNNVTHTSGDCNILGVPYKTGDLMGIATSFCLECRCAERKLYCSPRCCFNYAKYHMSPIEKMVAAQRLVVPLKNPLRHLLEESE